MLVLLRFVVVVVTVTLRYGQTSSVPQVLCCFSFFVLAVFSLETTSPREQRQLLNVVMLVMQGNVTSNTNPALL